MQTKDSKLFFQFSNLRIAGDNTEVVFKLSEENGNTKIDFTHIGLVPEVINLQAPISRSSQRVYG
jgi:hypothetical protein